MANSIIDDMLKNQVPNNKEKKSGARFIIFFLIFLIIIVAIALGVFWYLKNSKKETPKEDFINYLGKGNISSVFNFEKINELVSRIEEEESETSTEISANLSNGLFSSDIDISDMKLTLDTKNNPKEKKGAFDILLSYKDNDIISFNALCNSEKMGIISKDVIVKYIGTKYENLVKLINNFSDDEIIDDNTISNFDIDQFKDVEISLPQFSNDMLKKYINNINKIIPETAFSSKNITLDRDSGKIDVKEYTMKLNERQLIELIESLLQTFENDDQLIDALLSPLGDKSAEIKESLKLEIENYINSLYEGKIDDKKVYTIKVYGSNDITYKFSIDGFDNYLIDVDYGYEKNNNSLTITYLDKETQDGYTLDISKEISNVSEKLKIAFNIITNSEIVGKLEIVSDLVNSRKFIYFKKFIRC